MIFLIVIFIFGFWLVFCGALLKIWWEDHKAEKEFEKRQERYRKMI